MRKSPTAVQIPVPANAANIKAPPMTNGAGLTGWGSGITMNSDAIEPTANRIAMPLPIMATIALAVTPTGLLMRIIYFYIE
jgi:hypothetical protein